MLAFDVLLTYFLRTKHRQFGSTKEGQVGLYLRVSPRLGNAFTCQGAPVASFKKSAERHACMVRIGAEGTLLRACEKRYAGAECSPCALCFTLWLLGAVLLTVREKRYPGTEYPYVPFFTFLSPLGARAM